MCPTSNLGGWYFVSDNFEGYLIKFELYFKNCTFNLLSR